MKKIGPLTIDLVVASAIYHLKKTGEEARPQVLVRILNGKVMMSEISDILKSLMDWGIVRKEYTTLESGHAGNIYYITGEAKSTIRELYELFWWKIYNGYI